MPYVYLLLCNDGSFYAGWTTDLEQRISRHAAGKGGRYTRAHLPVRLAYAETLPTQREAMQREWALKRCSHEEKCRLAEAWQSRQ